MGGTARLKNSSRRAAIGCAAQQQPQLGTSAAEETANRRFTGLASNAI